MTDQLCPGCPGDPNETCCKPELRVRVWMDKQKTDEQRHIEAQAMQRLQMERLRDEFAMAALPCVPAMTASNMRPGEIHAAYSARKAYEMAAAMLTARTQEAA